MRMKRLIDDKRKKRLIWSLLILALIAVLTILGKHKLDSMNEQWRLEGKEVMNALQEKIDWLGEKTDLMRDAVDLESRLSEIIKCLKKKDGATQADINFVCRTRMKENMSEASELTMKCLKKLEELADLRRRLSAQLAEGESMVDHLRALASSDMGREIKNTRDKAAKFHSRLNKICERRIVLGLDFRAIVEECRRITELANKNEWKEHEKAHDDYTIWRHSIKDSLEQFDELDNALIENFRKLKAFPLDRENTQGMAIGKINDEFKAAVPLLSRGRDLCNNSVKRLDDELRKIQLTIESGVNSISEWREQHGDYVDAKHLTYARTILKAFMAFRRTSYEKLEERSRTASETLSKAEFAKSKATNALVSLQSIGDDNSDEQIIKKMEEGMTSASELQTLRLELDRELTLFADSLTETQSSATKQSSDFTSLLKEVERGFLDWPAEGRRIVADLNGIRQGFAKYKSDLETIQKTFVKYIDNGYSGRMASLKKNCSEILNMAVNGERLCSPVQKCSNGIELNELKKRRDTAKNSLEDVEQRTRALSVERNSALRNHEIFEIRYVPYYDSFASSLQKKKTHFEFALDIPGGGRHKVEIKFQKGTRTLFKSKTSHKVIAKCTISESPVGISTVTPYERCELFEYDSNTAVLRWNDLSKECSWGIILEGVFSPGINAIILDLSLNAINEKGNALENGDWQFQYKGLFGSESKDNFTVEAFVDGFSKNFLLREKVQ